jgi:DNA repair photolyase
MKPIYEPKGKAKEYGDYALNIYTGCPHRCFYCFAPSVLRKDRETFHTDIRSRDNIVEETSKQLRNTGMTDKLVHLCFTCDPYPTGYDSITTREIIKLLKDTGNHVQILTKGNGERDFDLLDENDWYGITFDGANHKENIKQLRLAHEKGIKTWISFEPVLNADAVIEAIKSESSYIDKVKIGKLNYYVSAINWKEFGIQVEDLCKSIGLNFYIKDSLREEMIR